VKENGLKEMEKIFASFDSNKDGKIDHHGLTYGYGSLVSSSRVSLSPTIGQ